MSINSLFDIYDLLIYYCAILIYFINLLYAVYNSIHTWRHFANKNLTKQAIPNCTNNKTRRKCIKILIKRLIFPNLYSTTTSIACEVDHGATKHKTHNDKIPPPKKCSFPCPCHADSQVPVPSLMAEWSLLLWTKQQAMQCFSMDGISPNSVPFIGAPCNTWFLGIPQVHVPNAILIESAVFPPLLLYIPYTLMWASPSPPPNCPFPWRDLNRGPSAL